MSCDDVRPRLTAYLDGDLDPDRGTVVRGHLRTCDACRTIAEREAVLRDGLRDLPTVDPPAAMWAGIQAQLAAAEVAESRRPAWKRALSRWSPMVPRFAMGGVLAAAAVGILWWRTHPAPAPNKLVDAPSPSIQSAAPVAIAPAPSIAPGCNLEGPADADVTADLAAEPARVTACYAQTGAELLAMATDARTVWSAEQRTAFDAEVATLRQAIDRAEPGHPQQRAWRALNRYLQRSLTQERVALGGAQ